MGNIKTNLLEVKSKGSILLNNVTTVVSPKAYLKKYCLFVNLSISICFTLYIQSILYCNLLYINLMELK